MSTQEETGKKEGPRSFAVTLQQIGEGTLHSELSKQLQTLVSDCTNYANLYEVKGKGSLTLTIGLVADPNGTVTVAGEVKAKAPKMKPRGSVFWATKGNNLSPENPRQQKLPLREVAPPSVRDLDDEEQEERQVGQ